MPLRIELAGTWHYAALPPGPEPSHGFCGLELSEGHLQAGDFRPRRTDCPGCVAVEHELRGLADPRFENLRRALNLLAGIQSRPTR